MAVQVVERLGQDVERPRAGVLYYQEGRPRWWVLLDLVYSLGGQAGGIVSTLGNQYQLSYLQTTLNYPSSRPQTEK